MSDKGCESSDAGDTIGHFCWLEVPVEDISRASQFYTTLFGWNCSPDPVPQPNAPTPDCPFKGMHFFSKGKAFHGAFMILSKDHRVVNHDEGRPQALPVLPTLNVKNCAETLKLAEENGGKTKWPKTDIGGGMGYYARLIDSEGNMIGIWSKD